MFNSREEKVAVIIAKKISDKYKCKCKIKEFNGNNYLYLFNKKIDLLITVCDTNKKKCIKIEEILIGEKYRNKGICTKIIQTIKSVALEYNVTVGLWCKKDNNKLFKFYNKLGFKHVETIIDNWLEFN